MRIGPQLNPSHPAAPDWFMKRMADELPKRGSQAGDPGWRFCVTRLQIGLEKGGPTQSAPSNGSASTS
ncbi:hypothetical protein D3C86_1985300 [compost metagenome]